MEPVQEMDFREPFSHRVCVEGTKTKCNQKGTPKEGRTVATSVDDATWGRRRNNKTTAKHIKGNDNKENWVWNDKKET